MAVDMNDYFNKKNGDGQQNKFQPPELPSFLKDLGQKASLLYVGVGVILFLIFFRPFAIINSGETGILVTLGKYEKTPLDPGFHLFVPFIQRVIVVDTRVRMTNYNKEDISADKKGITQLSPIQVLDSRGLPVEIELTIQYNLKPEVAPLAIASLGLNWEEKTINPNARGVVRSVIGNFNAEELPTKRDAIAVLIAQQMTKVIEKLPNQPINLISVQLRNIALPQKIKEQIELVQVANQEAEKAKYEVARAKQDAQKAEEIAKGIAQAKVIDAKGQAEANDLIGRSLSPNLVKLKQIEAQAKFNEVLKDNRNAQIFMTPQGSMPTIWMNQNEPAIKEKAAAK